MPFPFYNHSEDQAGFHFDGSAWTMFGTPLNPGDGSGGHWISACANVAGSPNQVYAVQQNNNLLSISTDAGQTWLQRTMTGLPTTTSIFSLWAPAIGQVYLVQRALHATDGIWRTLDDGLTWSRIVAPAQIGGHMAIGLNKMFYCAGPTSTTIAFHRCNLDASADEVWATVTVPAANQSAILNGLLLRTVSDDFVLGTSYGWSSGYGPPSMVLYVQASGATAVTPPGLAASPGAVWDTLPLSATQWLSAGNAASGNTNDVPLYGTSNAGASWSLQTTIPGNQGFVKNGAANSYFSLSAPDPATPSNVVMCGNAEWTVQQIFWQSTDAGATWGQLINTADPPDIPSGAGHWLVYGPGGLPSISPAAVIQAIPSRLATIVG